MVSKAELAWREKQKTGSIMKRSTFERIKRSAAARGARDPQAVAGAAYWRAVDAKYKARRRNPTRRKRIKPLWILATAAGLYMGWKFYSKR